MSTSSGSGVGTGRSSIRISPRPIRTAARIAAGMSAEPEICWSTLIVAPVACLWLLVCLVLWPGEQESASDNDVAGAGGEHLGHVGLADSAVHADRAMPAGLGDLGQEREVRGPLVAGLEQHHQQSVDVRERVGAPRQRGSR